MYPNKQVDDLRKAGNLDQALKLGRDLLKESPNDKYLKSSIGWVLHDQIKCDVQNAKSQSHSSSSTQLSKKIRSCLILYSELNLPRPDLLFSRIVFWAFFAPGTHEFLTKFLKWAGIDAFQPEDFRSNSQKDGRIYEPLVEKVALKSSKWSRDTDESKVHEFLVSFIDMVLERADVQRPQWLKYNKALLLQRLGKLNEAEELLIPVVREKHNEFWAWHALAKIKKVNNPATCLPLYAKACLCCKDSHYGVRVYEDLAQVAASQDEPGLARWAVDQAVDIRESQNWSLPQSLRNILKSDWYNAASIPSNTKERLEQIAKGSSSVIYADCPWVIGNFLGIFKAKNGREYGKIAIQNRESSIEIICPLRDIPFAEDYEIGTALNVKISEAGDRISLVEISLRSGGEKFDCVNHALGVIDHQNSEKKLASIYISDSEFCLLPYRDFHWVEALPSGAAIEIYYTKFNDRISAYHAQKADFQESPFITRVTGKISVKPKGFGFVGDVFVPPDLARNYEDGEKVLFIAIRKLNRKTNQLGWRALGAGIDNTVNLGQCREHG